MESGKKYIEAKIDVIELSASDVIATSQKPNVPDEEAGGWTPGI